MKFKAILLFGAPGSGKGTQGKILGSVPGFFHCACGDVFRSLDPNTEIGEAFLAYSSKGKLVPDDLSIALWARQISNMVTLGRYKPESDYLVLDGIPRNVSQAILLRDRLEVRRVFHLSCPDRSKLVERLQRRALRENRLDDANDEVIRSRLEIYANESKPVLDHYGPDVTVEIDSTQHPYQVLRDILLNIDRTASTPTPAPVAGDQRVGSYAISG